MIKPQLHPWSAFLPRFRWTFLVWSRAIPAACVATMFVVVQDTIYGGLHVSAPFMVLVAQYTLPWLTWAILAPALLFLFMQYPINLDRPVRGLVAYPAIGILAVGIKLLVSAPATAILIWRPLCVDWSDGLRWLFANRAGSNLLMFWLFVGAYTAWRYYHAAGTPTQTAIDGKSLDRIPVRAGAGTAFVSVTDVYFIESKRNQLVLHSRAGRHTLRSTLSELEQRLPRTCFVRIHRSHIVNIEHVSRIEAWGRGDYVVVMRDNSRLLSGKTYRDVMRGLLGIG